MLPLFREGERSALELVYRRYIDDVLQILRAGFHSRSPGTLTRVPGAADEPTLFDITQEVFVRAFAPAARAAYDGLRPYRPYLLQIARNIRIDQLRRAARELPNDGHASLVAIDLDSVIDSNAALPACDVPEDPAWSRLRAQARAHIATLSPEQQRFIELRFGQELAQVEVAERMAITRRRVRTLESGVFRSLRKALRIPRVPET